VLKVLVEGKSAIFKLCRQIFHFIPRAQVYLDTSAQSIFRHLRCQAEPTDYLRVEIVQFILAFWLRGMLDSLCGISDELKAGQ